MVVERALADADLGGDGVNADGADALQVEQPVGRLEDALPGLGNGLRPFHAGLAIGRVGSWGFLRTAAAQAEHSSRHETMLDGSSAGGHDAISSDSGLSPTPSST